jgi:hypothetical protein
MMRLRFLCGCSSKLLDVPVENRLKVVASFDAITFDKQGFIICAIHRERRYGWRAPSPAAGKGIQFMTDLEFQQKELFGIKPKAVVPANEEWAFIANRPDLRPQVPSEEDLTAALDEVRFTKVARQENGGQTNGRAFRENLSRVEDELIRSRR